MSTEQDCLPVAMGPSPVAMRACGTSSRGDCRPRCWLACAWPRQTPLRDICYNHPSSVIACVRFIAACRLQHVVSALRDKRMEAFLFAGILALAVALGAGVAHGGAKYVLVGFAVLGLSLVALTTPRYVSLLVLPALVLMPPTIRHTVAGNELTPLKVIVALGVAGWLVNAPRALRMPTGFRVSALVFSAYVMLLASSHGRSSLGHGIIYSIESLAIAWLAWRGISDKRDLLKLIDMLIGVMVIAALLAIYETIVGHFLLPAVGSTFFHAPLREGHIRAQGVFPHPLALGTALAVMLPVAITRGLGTTGLRRFLCAGAALLYALTLILISGRGPWIGAATAVVALAILTHGNKRLTIITGLLLCVVAVAISPLGGKVTSLLNSVVSNENGKETVYSVRYRKALLSASITYAEAHPFGTGPGLEETAHLTGTLEAGTRLNNSIDNNYAKYAVELGPVGLLLFLVLMVTVVISAWSGHNVKDAELALLASGILAGEIAMLVTSATVATFTWQQLATLFWLLVGASMMIEALARSSGNLALVRHKALFRGASQRRTFAAGIPDG